MPDVVLDVQAVQSRDHGERGIARYTLDLALASHRLAPDLIDAFVLNPALPISRGLIGLHGTGKLMRADDERLREGARVFHVASPFESLPLAQVLPAPIVTQTTRIVTTVYDLIPLRYPEIYLADQHHGESYRGRTALLRASDHVVCISDATACDVATLAGVTPSRVSPIYGGTSDIFGPGDADDVADARARTTDLLGRSAAYVLAPTGIEWRKNLPRLFEAYATLPADVRSAHPLVVQCHVTPDQRESLGAELRGLGIADDVVFTGFVSDELLVALYRCAHLVVFPSLYEGLGLPVLEARQCGAPVICGDNSSLRELVPLDAARFDAESVPAMADRLAAGVGDDAFRAQLTDVEVPSQFSWDAAAERFVAVLDDQLRIHRRRRPARPPRLAMVSPLPPTRCGPAMYLREMLPTLAEECDLTLFVAGPPEEVEIDVDVRVERLSLLETIERLGNPFDDVVYFMGNSEYHLFYPEFLRRRPGAVVLHDARYHGLYGEIARHRPDLEPGGLGGTLQRMYPGRYPAGLGESGGIHPDEASRLGVSMVRDIAERSTSLFAHSRFAADLVEFDCGIRPEVLFPLPVPAATGVGEGDPHLVGTFGIVAPIKAPDLIIEAIALDPQLRLVLVGLVGDEYRAELEALATRLGCAERVTFTGEVSDEEYDEWLRKVGVLVQLRRTSNGESSAAVNDAVATGTPVVLTDLGAAGELPDDVGVKVPVEVEPGRLAAAISSVAVDGPARRAMIAAQARYAEANSYPAAARALVARLVEIGVERRTERRKRSVTV